MTSQGTHLLIGLTLVATFFFTKASANVVNFPGTQFTHGEWYGECVGLPDNVKFCTIYRTFVSGEQLMLSLDSFGKTHIAVGSPYFEFAGNERITVQMQVDQFSTYQSSVIILGPKVAEIVPNNPVKAFEELRRGYALSLTADTGWSAIYNLKDTFVALEKLEKQLHSIR